MIRRLISGLIPAALIGANGCAPAPQPPVRCAVIGGVVASGMWVELAKRVESDTGLKLKLVAAGEKSVLVEAFHKGEADFATMHASDEAANLVADRFATDMRPWMRNELIIAGPADDPAGIRGMTNGAAALRKIAEARAPYVNSNGSGAHAVANQIWKAAGIAPQGDWVLKDESRTGQEVLQFAQKHHAYVIVGRIPILTGKMEADSMQIMVHGDPAMRRPYVVLVADAKRLPCANVNGAQTLADYLVSAKGQQFLKDFAAKQPDGVPLFYPIGADSGVGQP